MKSHCWLSLLALLVTVGCSSTEIRTYDISVTNLTNTDVTAWITKSASLTVHGGPFEATWASPEERQQEPPEAQVLSTDKVVRPGQKFSVHPTGEFDPTGDAYLRIYRTTDFNRICATDRGSPNRCDLTLRPGANVITITDDPSGQLTAVTDQP